MTRSLAFERVRATSLRSTWVFPLVGVVIAVLAALLGNKTTTDGLSRTMSDFVPDSFSFISALFLTIPFAQAFGHEYRDGTMRLTLSLFPHRRQVFAAKLSVAAIVASAGATVSVVAIAAIGLASGHVTDPGAMPAVLLRCVGFTLMWGLLVASVTVLTRNLAAGITGVLIWFILVEQLLVSLVGRSMENLDDYMPLLNGQRWVSVGQFRSAVVMLVPTLVLTLVALLKFERSDA